MSGIIPDRNGPWLSERLREIGVDATQIQIVGDRAKDMLAALQFMADHRPGRRGGGGADVPPAGDSVGDIDTFKSVVSNSRTGKRVGLTETSYAIFDIASDSPTLAYGSLRRTAGGTLVLILLLLSCGELQHNARPFSPSSSAIQQHNLSHTSLAERALSLRISRNQSAIALLKRSLPRRLSERVRMSPHRSALQGGKIVSNRVSRRPRKGGRRECHPYGAHDPGSRVRP